MHTFPTANQFDATWQQQSGEVPRQARPGSMSDQPGPGRPSGCTPSAVAMLRGIIRETGVSDSAAAVRLGMGASTVSRWKREDPEVRAFLEQAREECRALQLQKIAEAAAAENGRGWRAAAWMLERLFPEDYAASAGVREGHRQVAEARAERAERAYAAEEQANARQRKENHDQPDRSQAHAVVIPMPPQGSNAPQDETPSAPAEPTSCHALADPSTGLGQTSEPPLPALRRQVVDSSEHSEYLSECDSAFTPTPFVQSTRPTSPFGLGDVATGQGHDENT